MKKSMKSILALLIIAVFSVGVLQTADAATLADYTEEFTDTTKLDLTEGVQVEDGVMKISTDDGGKATVKGDALDDGSSGSITISIDAKAILPSSSRTAYAYTLLTVGSEATAEDKEEKALYIRAERNAIVAGIANGGTADNTTREEISGSGLSSSEFVNATLVYEYTNEEKGSLSLYVNGDFAGRIDGIDIPLSEILSSATVSMGDSIQTGIGGKYKGELDNLEIWHSKLSASEIAELNDKEYDSTANRNSAYDTLEKDLKYLKLESDTVSQALYYDQRVQDPVIQDVVLWTTGKISKNPIMWTSSDEETLNILTDDQGVTYKAELVRVPATDTRVTLTATISSPNPAGGYYTRTKSLVVTVPSWETRRSMDRAALEITSMDDVRDNLPLITQGKNGSTITWKSSNSDVISDSGNVYDAAGNEIYAGGIVTRPEAGEDPVKVTLTATITMPGVPNTLSKVFYLTVTPKPVAEDKVYDHYLFIYYAERNDWDKDGVHKEEVYFGISEDGIKWNDLNVQTRDDGTRFTMPMLISTVGDMGTRDPHIMRSPDGDKFYAMTTDLHSVGTALTNIPGAKLGYGETGNNFDCDSGNRTLVIWETSDLTEWPEPRLVKCNFIDAGNTYAPEAIWDANRDAYLVYWSSNNNDNRDENGVVQDSLKGGIYYCYTRDFITFSEPQLWFSYVDVASAYPEYNGARFSVYDTHLAYDEDTQTYYRFSTTSRLFVQTSNDLMGPWSDATRIPTANDSTMNTGNIEAPTTYQMPDGSWMLLGDNYRVYVPYQADDLSGFASGNYTDADLDYPLDRANTGDTFPRYKHGSIIGITQDEYNELISAFGTDEHEAGVDPDPNPNPNPNPGNTTDSKPTVTIVGNGSVSYSSNNTVITITPDAGWEISTVTLNGESKGAVQTLTGLAASDKVEIVFTETKTTVFIDISGHWAENDILTAVEKGLFTGITETTFEPDTVITRAMVVTTIYRLAGSPNVSESNAFSDVPSGQWYSNAINWAATNKIVSGHGDGTFAPLDNVTREQFALILFNYANFMKYDVTGSASLESFKDANLVSSWASAAMRWSVKNELINGKPGNLLDPAGKTTRAEAAVILVRFNKVFE